MILLLINPFFQADLLFQQIALKKPVFRAFIKFVNSNWSIYIYELVKASFE